MSDSTQLAVMQQPLVAATVFRDVTSVQDILGKVAAEVTTRWQEIVPAGEEPDVTDAGVREAIISLAYKVTRSKTALDELGKDFVSDLKRQAAGIDGLRRTIRERLDALATTTRLAVTEWEQAERERVAKHENLLLAIAQVPEAAGGMATVDIARLVRGLDDYARRDWQEYAARAAELLAQVGEKLRTLYAAAQTREAEQLELARLRQEAEERRQADAKAAAERAQAEAVAQAAQKAAQEAVEAERARVAQAEAEKTAQAAAEAERVAAQQRVEARRAANLNHRRRINREAAEGVVATLRGNRPDLELEEAQTLAQAIVEAIVLERIPHITIVYGSKMENGQ